MFWIYPSTAYCSPFCLDLEDIVEVLLQKSSRTLTAIALVPVLAMAFSFTVPEIVSDVATVTKGAGPWRSVNCAMNDSFFLFFFIFLSRTFFFALGARDL